MIAARHNSSRHSRSTTVDESLPRRCSDNGGFNRAAAYGKGISRQSKAGRMSHAAALWLKVKAGSIQAPAADAIRRDYADEFRQIEAHGIDHFRQVC